MKAFIDHMNCPEDASKHMRFRKLICTVFIPLIMITMLYLFDIRSPKISVYEVNVYDDGIEKEDGSIVVETHISAYDLKNTEVLVTAVVDRDYKQENDIDFESDSGPDPTYLTYDGKSGRSDTLVMYSDKETRVCRLRIPYKALYHEKGVNSYTISVTTHYRANGEWEYLYNKDGFHAYRHTFKTSNLKKPVRNIRKSTASPKESQTTQNASTESIEPIPNSLLGIRLGDSKRMVRNLLSERGIEYIQLGQVIETFRYYPTIYNNEFHEVIINFDTCGVKSIHLKKYIESDDSNEWEKSYESVKQELTKRYGDSKKNSMSAYKHGFLEYIYEDERDGKGCIFSNSGNNNFLILMGDPQYDIVNEEGYCISKIDILLMELPHHH